MRFSKQETLPLICLLILCMLIPAENPLAGPDKQKVHAHWLFASHRKQGHKILPIQGGPRIQLQGPVVMENDPIPPKVLLGDSSGYLHLASKKGEAELPPDQFAIEGWLRLDSQNSSGGILSASHPNGVKEGGWALGQEEGKLVFLIREGNLPMETKLIAKQAMNVTQWHHVVVNAKADHFELWMDGQLASRQDRLESTIPYPDTLHYEIGNWKVDAQRQPMEGAIHELYLLNQPATAKEIATRFNEKNGYFPPPGPEPKRLAIGYGPFVDWTSRSSVQISWNMDFETFTHIDLLGPEGEFREFRAASATKKHQVHFDELKPDAEYRFRIHGPSEGDHAQFSRLYTFDSSFHYAPIELRKAPEAPSIAISDKSIGQSVDSLLHFTGADKGFALLIGTSESQLAHAYALATASELKVIMVDNSPTNIHAARTKLDEAGVYGERVSVHEGDIQSLPYGPFFANLILMEATKLAQLESSTEEIKSLLRHLRPAGGYLCVPCPTSTTQIEQALRKTLQAPDLEWRSLTLESSWVTARRGILLGSGDWSHQYGGADNSSCSQDALVSGDLGVLWWGDPGPRPMPDRGPRNPAPISVNGRLYIQGDRILFGLDAYNGTILWNYFSPEMRRANLPRDCSNMIGTHDYLYVAQGRHCIGIEGHSGRREMVFEAYGEDTSMKMDWGYLASHRDMLIGSSVKAGSGYLGDDGEWFEEDHPEDVSRVVSSHLFAMDRHRGEPLWTYTGGAIINSTITIGGEEIFFLESRNPEAISASTGRLTPETLTDLRLVCLDLKNGQRSWERVHDFSACQFMTYMTYSNDTLVVAGADKQKHYHTFAFSTRSVPNEQPDQPANAIGAGSLLWEESHEAGKNHHSGHLQHPVVIGDTYYSDQRAFSLRDGKLLRTDLPERRGCGTMSAALNSIFYRHYYHGQWDLQTNQRTQFEGLRSGCWLGMIPAGGLLLAPEASAGCSCENAIQTSVGYVPKHLDPISFLPPTQKL